MVELGPNLSDNRRRVIQTPRLVRAAGALLALTGTTAALANPAGSMVAAPEVLSADCGAAATQLASELCVPENLPPACLAQASVSGLRHFKVRLSKWRAGVRAVMDENLTNAPDTPRILSFEDDRATIYNDQGRAGAVHLLGRAMGATQQRFVIYPYRFKQSDFRTARYDRALAMAKACNYDIQLTLSCDKTNWTPRKFRLYVGSVTRRYAGIVDRVAICNEPNYPGWLRPMKGKSLPETYRQLYSIGSKTVKRVDPRIETIFGEFSSLHKPLVFMNKVLACPDRPRPCKPLYANYVGYHPYKWFQEKLPKLNKKVKPSARVVGIDSLPTVEAAIQRASKKRLLITPTGQPEKLLLTEFAEPSRGEGKMKDRIMYDRHRAELYAKIMNIVCQDEYIVGISFYQLDNSLPLSEGGNQSWNTSMANKWGVLDASYYAIQTAATRTHAECFKR